MTALAVFIFINDEESLFGNDAGLLEGCCGVLDQTCKADVGINTLSQYESNDGSFYELLANYVESEKCNDAQVDLLLSGLKNSTLIF